MVKNKKGPYDTIFPLNLKNKQMSIISNLEKDILCQEANDEYLESKIGKLELKKQIRKIQMNKKFLEK